MSQEEATSGVIEHIADCMHQLWAGWTAWMLSNWSETHPSGERFQARWQRQMATPYSSLSEQEKESDRHVARRLLEMLEEMSLFVVSTPDLLWRLSTEREARQRAEAESSSFARLVIEMWPRTLVMENVPEIATMVTPDGLPVMDALCLQLERAGYGTFDALRRALSGRPEARAAIRIRTQAGGKAMPEQRPLFSMEVAS